METWRLLDLEYENSYMNLAVEEAIPRIVGVGIAPNTIRFWRNPNTVVIGRFQCIKLEVNLKAAEKYRTTVVRRFTGGGAVYHDYGNLNFAISVDKNHSMIPKDLSRIYHTLSLGVIRGLKLLGFCAEFTPPNTLNICGKKVSGSAGSLNWGVIFYHGTLLVISNLRILSEVLNRPLNRARSAVPSNWTQVMNLRNETDENPSFADVKTALTRGFEETFGINLLKGKLLKKEKELAYKLYKEKYSQDDWNFKI